MKVKLCIISTASAEGNKRPLSGDVTFDDGKHYGWNVYGGEIAFTGHRNVYGSWQSFSFRSASRAQAVQDALDGADPDAIVRTRKEHAEMIRDQEQDRIARRQKEREEHDEKVMREGGTLSNGQEVFTLTERTWLRGELRRQNEAAQAVLEKSGRRGMHPRIAAIRAEQASQQNTEEKRMRTSGKDPIDQRKYYKEKEAIAEGWVISASDNGFQLQRIDDPEEWPGFDPQKATPFETDEAVFEHVVARAWAGSLNHRSALNFLERAAPEEYARTADGVLQTASILYRRAEEARIAEHRDRIWSEIQADPNLKSRLQEAYSRLDMDMNRQHASRPGLKSYEAHHANSVAREAFLLGYMDTGTPEGALDAARRRMLITTTPHAFYRDALAAPVREVEAELPSP